MNYREFSAQIKAKYPQYVDMDDRELASAVLQKHPQYRKMGIVFEDEPQQLSDDELRRSLVVSHEAPGRQDVDADPSFYRNQQAWERSRSTPIGKITDAIGSGAAGFLQGATGGLAKAALMAHRGATDPMHGAKAGAAEWDRAAGASAPAATIGELVGGITTGRGIGKMVAGSGAARAAGVAASKLPKVGSFAGKAVPFAIQSTAQGAPWVSQAALQGGVGEGIKEAGINVAADALLGQAGRLVKKGVQAALPITTRVSKEALDAWTTKSGKKLIREMAGQGEQLTDFVTTHLDKFDEFLPEYRRVEDILQAMPPIKKSKLMRRFEEVKFPADELFGINKDINATIDAFAKDIDGAYPGRDPITKRFVNPDITADKYKKMVQALDNQLFGKYGKESNVLATRLKKLRHVMSEDLKEVAPKEYRDLMDEIHYKLKVKEAVADKVGTAADMFSRTDRTERFLSGLTHKNKVGSNRLVDELGTIFGSDIKAKAQALSYARQLGIDPMGKNPAWINTIFLRSLVGGISGGASIGIAGGMLASDPNVGRMAGTAAGVGLGFAATSPRIGSTIYGASKSPRLNQQLVRDVAKTRHTINDLIQE